MDLNLVTKPLAGSDALATDGLVRKHLERKLTKIESAMGGKSLSCRAVLEELSTGFQATISIQGKQDTVGKAKEPELLRAVDVALDRVTRQVRQRREKLSGKERGRRASGEIKQMKGDSLY